MFEICRAVGSRLLAITIPAALPAGLLAEHYIPDDAVGSTP